MPARAYVELYAKSAFSFLEGASTPEQLAAECARYGQLAIALADVNGVYGSSRLHYTAKKIGSKPLVGAEVGLPSGARLTLLVETQAGYKSLTRLITQAKLRNGLNRRSRTRSLFPKTWRCMRKGLFASRVVTKDRSPLR